jgi:uncharacterized membrane protein
MNERRRTFAPPAVGGSSLLVIFGVLCLTVFAVLALSTAQADARLSRKGAEAAADYYAADTRAEEILAQLRAGSVPAGVAADGDTYTYTVPISSVQALDVAVEVRGAEYAVLSWRAVSTADWHSDSSLDLWDGEDLPLA